MEKLYSISDHPFLTGITRKVQILKYIIDVANEEIELVYKIKNYRSTGETETSAKEPVRSMRATNSIRVDENGNILSQVIQDENGNDIINPDWEAAQTEFNFVRKIRQQGYSEQVPTTWDENFVIIQNYIAAKDAIGFFDSY